MAVNAKSVDPLPHHQQRDVCVTRPRYRQGRKDTAVKVYTIHHESKYLLIHGVPAIGIQEELERRCSYFGEVVNIQPLHDYPSEQFTVVYLVSYSKLQSARVAKRKLDNYTWFGSPLHVCYAPEYETVEDTRIKLRERQKYVDNSHKIAANRSSNFRPNHTHQTPQVFEPEIQTPVSNSTNNSTTYIWAGKEYTINTPADPNNSATNSEPETSKNTSFVPRQLSSKRKVNNSADQIPADIKAKLNQVATPNLGVQFKRKRVKL